MLKDFPPNVFLNTFLLAFSHKYKGECFIGIVLSFVYNPKIARERKKILRKMIYHVWFNQRRHKRK